MGDQLLTIDQACDHLQMSRGALAQLRYTGNGPQYLALTPKTIRYKKEWIDDWVAASARMGTAA